MKMITGSDIARRKMLDDLRQEGMKFSNELISSAYRFCENLDAPLNHDSLADVLYSLMESGYAKVKCPITKERIGIKDLPIYLTLKGMKEVQYV